MNVQKSIEQSWIDAIRPMNRFDRPENVWFNLISTVPSSSWRPDTDVEINIRKSITKSTLLSQWFEMHDGSWSDFFNYIAKEYPVLNTQAVIDAFDVGCQKNLTVPYKKKVDSVAILTRFLENYKNSWISDEVGKNKLLELAVNANALPSIELIVKNGADAKKVVHLVRSKDALDIISKNAAIDFKERVFKNSNKSVDNFLTSRKPSSYEAVKDRKDVIEILNNAKKSELISSTSSGEKLDKLITQTFDILQYSPSAAEITKIIVKNQPDIWLWRTNIGGGVTGNAVMALLNNKNVLMEPLHDIDILPALKNEDSKHLERNFFQ